MTAEMKSHMSCYEQMTALEIAERFHHDLPYGTMITVVDYSEEEDVWGESAPLRLDHVSRDHGGVKGRIHFGGTVNVHGTTQRAVYTVPVAHPAVRVYR